MLLHIGANQSISSRELLFIADAQTMASCDANRFFLECAKREGRLIGAEPGTVSYVACFRDGKTLVFCSCISPATLLKRSEVFSL